MERNEPVNVLVTNISYKYNETPLNRVNRPPLGEQNTALVNEVD